MSIPPFRINATIPVSAIYGLDEDLSNKVTANPPIPPGTNIKISYDQKGLVTSGTGADLPDLSNVDGTITSSALATLRVLASPSFDTNFNYVDWTPSGGGGGGSYTASNVGTGTGVFNTLIGNNFTFNSLSASSNKVSLSLASNTIGLDVVPSNFTGIPQSGVTNLVSDLASKQPLDATLTALSNLDNSTGLISQTGIDTFTKKILLGTSDQVIVTNGNGVSGNPTFSLPQDIGTLSSPTFLSETLTSGLVLDQNTIGGPTTSVIPPSTVWQSFTAGITGSLKRVLWAFDVLPISNYIISLYSGVGTSGTLLYQFTITLDVSQGDADLLFPIGQSIFAGFQYTIALQQTPATSNMSLTISNANPYPGGRSDFSPGSDYNVRTFVEQVISLNPTIPISINTSGAIMSSGPLIVPQLTTSARDLLPAEVKTNGSIIFNSTKGYCEKYNTALSTWYPLNSSTIISGISAFNTNGISDISLGSSEAIITGAPMLYPTYVWCLGFKLSQTRTGGSVTVNILKNDATTSATVTLNTDVETAFVIFPNPIPFAAGDEISAVLVASSFSPSGTDCVFTCGIAS